MTNEYVVQILDCHSDLGNVGDSLTKWKTKWVGKQGNEADDC